MPQNTVIPNVETIRPNPSISPEDGTDSGQGSGPLSDAFVVETERHPRAGPTRRVKAPPNISRMEVRRSSRVASQTTPIPMLPPTATFSTTLPGTRRVAGYVYEVLPSPVEASPSLQAQPSDISDPPGNVDGSRDISIPQASMDVVGGSFSGHKRSATSDGPKSPRRGQVPVISHPMRILPSTPALSGHSVPDTARVLSPIASNPLLHHPMSTSVTSPLQGRRPSTSHRARDSNTAWAAAAGLLPISDAFRTPGYALAHVVGRIANAFSPHSERLRPAGPCDTRQLLANHPRTVLTVSDGPLGQPSDRVPEGSAHVLAPMHVASTQTQTSLSHPHDILPDQIRPQGCTPSVSAIRPHVSPFTLPGLPAPQQEYSSPEPPAFPCIPRSR
ncbi:hypothetical protein BYT27DRAFT_6495396 [Phlegmacium glaucopus]|nr:hypothetical protein BYT27DRAFT_6495396 [Phlegmacium glaucopus]